MLAHVAYGIFLLILLFLVLSHGGQASQLISAGAASAEQYTKTLQGR